MEAATRGVLRKTVFLEIWKTSVPESLFKKKTLEQVLSCDFYEISKNTFLQNIFGRLLLSIR